MSNKYLSTLLNKSISYNKGILDAPKQSIKIISDQKLNELINDDFKLFDDEEDEEISFEEELTATNEFTAQFIMLNSKYAFLD